MKKGIIYGLVSGAVLFCTIVVRADFVQVAPYSESVRESTPPQNYKLPMIKAMSIHNMLVQMGDLKETHENLKVAEDEQKFQEARFNALNTCNVNLLEPYYKNPEEAWQNITKTYDDKEKEIAIYVNSADPSKPGGLEEMRTEYMAFWTVGKDVLTDVYAQPEKYGELKNKNTSFPLWEDQKYLYAKELTDFSTRLNAFFGKTGLIPGLSLSNTYAENAKAYEAYLTQLTAQYPAKAKSLPASLKTLPIPPKALPPAQEIVRYFDDPSVSKTVFPEWPEPWKKFINSGFKDYNPTGEMAQNFKPKSLQLKDEIKHRNNELENNRLNAYQQIKKELDGARKVTEASLQNETEQIKVFEQKLKENGINVSVNMKDKTQLSELRNQLIDLKQTYLKEAEEILAQQKTDFTSSSAQQTLQQFASLSHADQVTALQSLEQGSPEYMEAVTILNASQTNEDVAYIKALTKDAGGETYVFPTNAKDIDQLINAKRAEQALIDEVRKNQKEKLQKNYGKKIDSMCLNGGV